jgi:uncharacterized membrane protein required for colicin V production
MNYENLPAGVFDVILALALLMGFFRGRKHGMSEELMKLVKWLILVVVCSLFYQPLGQALANSGLFSLLASYIIVYAVLALAVVGVFALFKHYLGEKLVGSDFFGRSEFYLGMGSGVLRFACILVVVLAVLNAPWKSGRWNASRTMSMAAISSRPGIPPRNLSLSAHSPAPG